MRVAHRTSYAVIVALSCIAILLRYPVDHEQGVDTFDIHGIANIIIQTGSMGWLVTPLSYLGMAPMSYPPAVPATVASFSLLAGLSVETTILAYSLMLGVVLALTSFLLGHTAFRSDRIGWLTAFLTTSAGGLVAFTDWTASSRGMFLTLVPLALAFLIRTMSGDKHTSQRAWGMLLLVICTMVLTHLMWVLFVPLIIAAALVRRIGMTQESLLRHKSSASARDRVIFITLAAVALGFATVILLGLPGSYGPTGVASIRGGLLPDNAATRLGVYLATTMGVGIVAIPFGIARTAKDFDRRRRYVFLSLVVSFFPVALEPVYGALVATPIALLVVALAFHAKPKASRGGTRHAHWKTMAVALCLCVATLVVPALVSIPRSSSIQCNQGTGVSSQAYNSAIYLKYAESQHNFTFIWSDPLNAARIEAISGIPALEPDLSLGTLGYPWLAQKAHIQLVPSTNLWSSLTSTQQLLAVKEWIPGAAGEYGYFWGKHTALLEGSSPQSSLRSAIVDFYNAKYAVELCRASGSVLYTGFHQENYLIYSDGVEAIFKT